MSDPNDLRRISAALGRAVAPERDDFEHTDYAQLEAYVDDRLDEVDREMVQAHVSVCPVCAEDVADLQAVRAQLAAPLARRSTGRGWIAAAAAAGIVLSVVAWQWGRDRSDQTVAVPAAQTAAAPASVDDGLRADERAAIAEAIASGTLPVPPAVRTLAGTDGILLGPTSGRITMGPLSPTGTAVAVASPEFTWRTIDGAASYTVAIFDTQFREVAASGRLATTRWTPSKALPRGIVLTWQVKATLADGSDVLAPAPPHPEARFVVLDETTAAAVVEQRARLGAQPFELGILLSRAGLLDDAEHELHRVAADSPAAANATKLLATLRRR